MTHNPSSRPQAERRWRQARLVAPRSHGYLFVGVRARPRRWPLTVAHPSRHRAQRRLTRLAALLGSRGGPVHEATVFTALFAPPGQPRSAGRRPVELWDTVLLVQTEHLAAAEGLGQHAEVQRLVADYAESVVLVARNVRRIEDVDHGRQGVFLFNYFTAPNAETNLTAWLDTAGWFQDETGLDNSTVLEPTRSGAMPYTLVNHCRWDRLVDIVPALVAKASFRTFVLRRFHEAAVEPNPVLYRLVSRTPESR